MRLLPAKILRASQAQRERILVLDAAQFLCTVQKRILGLRLAFEVAFERELAYGP
jgi:hypothetical protein